MLLYDYYTLKDITTHKSRGLTLGPDKTWNVVVAVLSTGSQRRTPGAELVGFSIATDSEMLAIGQPITLD